MIEQVFKAGYEYRMDANTIQEALNVIKSVTEVKNIQVANSTFSNI